MNAYRSTTRRHLMLYLAAPILIAMLACSFGGLLPGSKPGTADTPAAQAIQITQSEWDEKAAEVEQVPVAIPETTVVMDEGTSAALTSVSGDGATLTFSESTPELEVLSPGEVVVGDSSDAAPDGFLRKVTNVTTSGGQVVVETDPARLEEAIESGTVQVTHTLTLEEVQAATPGEGIAAKKVRMAPAKAGFEVRLDNVVLADKDGNANTTYDQVLANGSVFLDPAFDFRLTVKNYTLKELTFINRTTQRAALEISAGADLGNLNVTKEISRYKFSPITVWVGWVPVVINPTMSVNVGVDGDVSVDMRTGISQEATLKTGLTYKNGNWRPVYELSNEFNFTPPTLSGNCNVRAYVGPRLDLMLYGQPGPFGEITGYLALDADPASIPWWKLHGGMQATMGVDFEVLSHSVASYHTKVFDERWPLAQAETAAPEEESPLASAPTATLTKAVAPSPPPASKTPVPTKTHVPTKTALPTFTATLVPTNTPMPPHDVEIVLRWNDKHDLDLWVDDPNGFRISYPNWSYPGSTGGFHHGDVPETCSSFPSSPQERVSWPNHDAPSGEYVVIARYAGDYCIVDGTHGTNFEITVRVDGTIVERFTGWTEWVVNDEDNPSFTFMVSD
jgi:hypothetical protein